MSKAHIKIRDRAALEARNLADDLSNFIELQSYAFDVDELRDMRSLGTTLVTLARLLEKNTARMRVYANG